MLGPEYGGLTRLEKHKQHEKYQKPFERMIYNLTMLI